MTTRITILTDQLLPTEKILWHRLPILRAPRKGKPNLIPIIIGSITVIFVSFLFILSVLSGPTQTTNPLTFIVLIAVALGLIGAGLVPLISYNFSNDIEYLITNQRVLIYPSPYAEKNRPKIINLYEINGEIEMKYDKDTGTGSIYIPTPHWNRIANVQSNMTVGNRAIISPDITGIKDPHIAYDILIEAIAIGKRTNWK